MDLALPMIDLKKTIIKLIDIDVLIELVKDRPIIWDNSVEGYRNKDICAVAWEEIFKTIFDSYNEWSEEQRLFVGKIVKQKWTTARDVWQRTHKKRKEALQSGEHFSDVKNNGQYEKLKFLAKVYDKMDSFQSDKEKKIFDQSVGTGNIDNPPSPQADYNDDIVIDLENVGFQRTVFQVLKNPNKSHEQGANKSAQKRKLEHNVEMNTKTKKEQGSNSQKPVQVVNLNDGFRVGSLLGNIKHRTSIDSRDASKSNCKAKQSPKREPSTYTPLKEELPLYSSNLVRKNSNDQNSQKLEAKSPGITVKEEDTSNPGVSRDSDTIPNMQITNGIKRKISETPVEQPSSKKTGCDVNSSNTHLENFLQLLKPRIEDFNKPQMMDFFFEILTPLIKDFDKHKFLDFQIEVLQLIKKIEGK